VKGLAHVRVTLYDIFGYLLPGLVVVVSLAGLVWSIFLPSHPLHSPRLSGAEWFGAVIAGYFLGHLAQALADDAGWVWRKAGGGASPEKRILCGVSMKELTEKANASPLLAALFAGDHTDWDVVYQTSDTAVAQCGSTADREIYQYREGFYRGLVVALFLGFVALIIHLIRGGVTIQTGAQTHAIGRWPIIFALFVVVIAGVLSYVRFRRFEQYRIRNALLAFVVLDETGRLKHSSSQGTGEGAGAGANDETQ